MLMSMMLMIMKSPPIYEYIDIYIYHNLIITVGDGNCKAINVDTFLAVCHDHGLMTEDVVSK